MNEILINVIAYSALAISLYSMSTKGEYKLRLYSLFANLLYIIYGTLIHATPVIVGCIIAVFLHSYHLRNLRLNKTTK